MESLNGCSPLPRPRAPSVVVEPRGFNAPTRFETPAESRALRAIGADAVGMSTAVEAETAAALGLTVAGISCVTNKAAGLSDGPLSHGEVEATAKTAVAKLAEVLTGMIREL